VASPVESGTGKLRFVNAGQPSEAVDLGIADDTVAGFPLLLPIFVDVPFGDAGTHNAHCPSLGAIGTPDCSFPIDSSGYLALNFQYGTASLGAAMAGNTSSTLVQGHVELPDPGVSPYVFTVFEIGTAGDAAHPRTFWVCDEGSVVGELTSCALAP
jgi:hypothetical protein